tara:strand:- start:529 stop:1023 length:495 start_codon:yes stop_codon:yes gene_type:complete
MKSGLRLGNIPLSLDKSIINSKDFFANKRVLFFSINKEDFNSEKVNNKIIKFENYFDRIKKLGIDDVLCCMIDSYENIKNKFELFKINKIKIISDEKGQFNEHLGVLNTISSNKNFIYSYMAIITDGIIEKWWEELKSTGKDLKKEKYIETSAENSINYLSGTE